jgi:hypothetical protein
MRADLTARAESNEGWLAFGFGATRPGRRRPAGAAASGRRQPLAQASAPGRYTTTNTQVAAWTRRTSSRRRTHIRVLSGQTLY